MVNTTNKGERLTLENADRLIYYYTTYQVIICTEHRYAVQNLDRHLYDYHGGEVAIRRRVVALHSHHVVLKPHQVQLPPPLGRPIHVLAAPVRALHCQEDDCSFVTPSIEWMRKHCAKAHLWHPTRSERIHWNEVQAQTFFPAGKQRYFTVLPEVSTDARSTTSAVPVTGAHLAKDAEFRLIMDNWVGKVDEHRQELEVVDTETAKQDHTGWFNRTGWPRHLKGTNLKHLATASDLPAKDEHHLATIATLVERLVENCVSGLDTLHLETRRWLRSPKVQEPDHRPLSRLQNRASQQRYAGYLKRFVCYSLRVADRVLPQQNTSSRDNVKAGRCIAEEDDDSGSSDNDTCQAQQDLLYDAERLYPWRNDQLAQAQRLLDAVRMAWSEADQMQALLDFCTAFIQHKVWADPLENGLVHFLAVLGINSETGRLREAHDFSYMLAGVIYCIRVLTAEALLPCGDRQTQTEASTQRFLAKRLEFLVDGSYGPVSYMLGLLAYSKHLAMNHGNAGMIDWPSEELMTLRGERIYMAKFREMMQNVLTRAENILWQELMWCTTQERFDIDLDGMEDDVTFTKRGYSFVNRPSNALDKGLDWMLDRMLKSQQGSKLRRKGVWQKHRARQYLRSVDEFKQLLLFLVHVTGGQPARGPEITSLRFKNGFLQDRNVFVISGQVTTVTRYHKSQWQWDTPKVIPRFLPWRAGQLMAVYIAYLQPFAEMLSVTAMGTGWTDYIWADGGGPWETERLTKVIARETATGIGVRLTTLSYRHTAAAIGRRKVGAAFARGFQEEVGEGGVEEMNMDEEEAEAAIELAAGRTTKIGESVYGVSSSVVKHLSVRSMDTFRPLCEAWHSFLGLASYKPGSRTDKKAAWKLRGGNSYSNSNNDDQDIQQEMKRQKRSPDMDSSTMPTLATDRPSTGPTIPATMSTVTFCGTGKNETLFTAPVDDRVQEAMQKALGTDKVHFRSEEQAEALRAVLRQETPLVVILPTGGGKSLLFTTVACMGSEAGMTIVVVPFRQLIRAFVDSAHERGIECEEWQPGTTDPVRLMMVSADRVPAWRFLDFAARMKAKGILRRVFVDECHLAFTAHSWRPKLAEMKRIRCLGVPTTFLTATLPPAQVFDFEKSMNLDYARYIRATTARAKTRYQVHTCKTGSLLDTATEVCKRRTRHLRPGQKAVAYCRSRDQTEVLARRIGCSFVHAKADNNKSAVDKWLAESGFIVATSALGTGVDFPGIVFVLHVGLPHGLIDYGQESGRAGRAGEDVASVILLEEGLVEKLDRQGRARSIDEEAMEEYVTTQSCRRKVLNRYFDGSEEDCAAGTMARCDRCGEGEVDIQRSERVLAEDRSVVERVLDELADGCVTCWLQNLKDRQRRNEDDGWTEWRHWRQDCEQMMEVEETWERFRDGLSLDLETHSCYKCGFSQKLCRTGVGPEGQCQWPGVVYGILVAATEGPVGRGIIRRAGYKGEFEAGLGRYRRWARRTHQLRIWGELMSNAMAVVLEFILWSDSL